MNQINKREALLVAMRDFESRNETVQKYKQSIDACLETSPTEHIEQVQKELDTAREKREEAKQEANTYLSIKI